MTMVTRSGRISKQPERFSPQERITDDYSDEDYSDYSEDDDVSSAVSYSTDEGREYVEDGFVERDDAPVDRTDDEWVPEEGEEDATDEDAIEEDSETFTDDEEALKEAEELKKNYREKESIVADGTEDSEEGFTDDEDDEDDDDMDEDDSDLIEGDEGFTDEDEDIESEDDDDDITDSEDFEDVPIDPKESRKRVQKALADKDNRAYLHELGVDPSETRNLGGVPMLEGMELNEGFLDEPVDLTQ